MGVSELSWLNPIYYFTSIKGADDGVFFNDTK